MPGLILNTIVPQVQLDQDGIPAKGIREGCAGSRLDVVAVEMQPLQLGIGAEVARERLHPRVRQVVVSGPGNPWQSAPKQSEDILPPNSYATS